MCNKTMDPLLDLHDKVAIISGGSSGIGYGTAELLAAKGAVSIILDINERSGKEAVQKIVSLGGKADFIKCNVPRIKIVLWRFNP